MCGFNTIKLIGEIIRRFIRRIIIRRIYESLIPQKAVLIPQKDKNMDTPSFKEDHISQIPALQLLQNLGYQYLSPEEAIQLRAGKTTNVLLDDILRLY